MTLSPNWIPVVIEGPLGELPDPLQTNLGTIFVPDGLTQIMVCQVVNGVRAWTTVGTGSLVTNNVHSRFLSGSGTVADPLIFSLPTDVEYWVDPTTGSDSGAGDAAHPVQTLAEALLRLAPGWKGKARVHLNPGTYALGASPKIIFPVPRGGVAAEPLVIDGLGTTDSGQGTRTTGVGSTTGSLQTFGNLVDSVGGLTVNAFRGMLLRFTSGALGGTSYWIYSNDATSITIASQFASAPVAGATYVIETSSQLFTWSGTLELEGAGAVGLYNVTFSSGASIDLRGPLDLYTSKVNFVQNQLLVNQGASMSLLSAFTPMWPSGSLPVPSAYLLGCQLAGGSLFPLYGSRCSFNNSFFNGCKTSLGQGAFFSAADTGFSGAASIIAKQAASASLIRTNMNNIVPVAFNTLNPRAFGAAIVVCEGSFLALIDTIINGTTNATAPGDAVLIVDKSCAVFENVSGTANAGVGVRILASSHLSNAAHNLGNTVTGTGDVVFGSTGPLTWAGIGAARQTDAAQLCLIEPGN